MRARPNVKAAAPATFALACLLGAAPVAGAGGGHVTIDAAQGQPVAMATYPGPNGVPIPVGACGAVIKGDVWVLPCDSPEVRAYRQAQAAAAAARERRQFWITAVVADVVLLAMVGAVAWDERRRSRARQAEGAVVQ